MKIQMRAFSFLMALTLLIGIFSITASADSGTLVSGIGFVNTNGLNFRQQPTVGSSILATANIGECVVVLGQEGEWYHVIYNLQTGYMNAAYLNVAAAENAELGNGSVTGSSVNIRSGPGTNYPKVKTANKGDSLYIIGLNNGWYKVLLDNSTGYIRSDYLELKEIPYENRASAQSPKYFRGGKAIGALPVNASRAASAVSYSGYATGAQIVEKAEQYLGTPYVYGGASPSGFDCSGFVYYVFGTFGISVGRVPSAQNSVGTYVAKSDLRPGDIVLFSGTGGSGGISHSGIYVGGGQFIHSPNSRSTVSFADLTTGYWSQHYYTARRVV